MLAIHPVIQYVAIILILYVFFLGFQRFRFLHLQKKVVFKWRRHVTLGIISLGMLCVGMVAGIFMVYVYWHGFFITGIHGKLGLVMVFLIMFGLVSGLYMNYQKKKRKLLPIIHGLNNLFVLLLACIQIITGWKVYGTFVLGG